MPAPARSFWQRITDGIELQELWKQFQAEARYSYEWYSKEVEWEQRPGEDRGKRAFRLARALFWAMMEKLTPARRVLLLIALVMLVWPGIHANVGDTHIDIDSLAGFGGLILLLLLALELADRVIMKRDLEIAREIQNWLMPAAPPTVPGVDMAFSSRPANTVAGDYHDAFFRPGNPPKLLVVVADVAGKSIPAAMLMATVQASLRTLAASSDSLVEVVRRLNRYVCAQIPGGRRFTTAFLAELDPATGAFEYVNAGHNWPVLQRASGAVERLETGGLPLGIRPEAAYELGSSSIAAGDLLLIFTDGLVEAENGKAEEYGETRMLETLHRLRAASAADALRGLTESVNSFVGATRQHDDITCLALRVSSTSA